MSPALRALRRFKFSDLSVRNQRLVYAGALVTGTTATLQYKFKECIEIVGNPAQITSPTTIFWLRLVFGRMRSRWAGALSECHVPVALRVPLFSFYAWKYGADLEEVRYPLDSFRTFNDFFCRLLRDGARPIADAPQGLISPVDGRVLTAGVVEGPGARIEQIKGATYSVPAFLGLDPVDQADPSSAVHYVVLYLAPGDYHRIHAPCEFGIQSGRHFSGELFSVSPSLISRVDDVFTVNERVVLSGKWRFGHMHLVAVAAANVGNIFLDFDPKLQTNRLRDISVHCGGDISSKIYPDGVPLDPGSPVGGFRLGSTVVLIFEGPRDFRWQVAPGDAVRMGQPLGEAVKV